MAGPVGEANRRRGVERPLGHRVAEHLLDTLSRPLPPVREVVASVAVGEQLRSSEGALLVMGDGSARRREQAPGHLHPDALAFDARLEQALRTGDAAALAALDPALAEELWCDGVPALQVLAEVARDRAVTARVTYADAPYGVAWWVALWTLV